MASTEYLYEVKNLKDMKLTVELVIAKRVWWRLRAFMILMRFAAWVGGFDTVEIAKEKDNDTNPHVLRSY